METSDLNDQLAITDEKIGYDQDQLVVCLKCGRNNGPDRLRCMYCAAELDVPETVRTQIDLRPTRPEAWENGFNVIGLRGPETPANLAKTASSAGIAPEFLEKALSERLPLPLVRVGSGNEARMIAERLSASGISTELVSDEELKTPLARRLRSIDTDENTLLMVLFNSDEVVRVASDDVELTVVGKIFENEIVSTESRRFRKGELDEQVASRSAPAVIDVYTEDTCFRINEHGFDFSCLGTAKTYVASENMMQLVEFLRVEARDAAYDTSYVHLRGLLGEVWPLEEIQEAGGVSRTGAGKVLVTRTTKQTSAMQFDKYSRMLRRFK